MARLLAEATEERLFRGLAAQAGLPLRAVALRAELAERLRDSTRRAAELLASRERVVTAQDEERRRLERDIHDGAQQHLVALAVQLRLAGTLVARESPRAAGVVAGQRPAAVDAITTLADLAHGIYPRQLAEAGVGAGLAAAVTAPVDIAVDDLGRLPTEIESALYFCALEARQNLAKHAGGSRVSVRAGRVPGAVELVVSDDGPWFAPDTVGAGRGWRTCPTGPRPWAASCPWQHIAHAGRTVTDETADHTFRIYHGDQLLTEVARTTTKPIARFNVRKPEPSSRPHSSRPASAWTTATTHASYAPMAGC